MSWTSKVIWTEGMLLQPQHLQQHDRYLEQLIEHRVAAVSPYTWGFTALQIDEHLLTLGKFALLSCAAVLPDGTAFAITDEALPTPIDIPEKARDVTVVLALPLRQRGVNETSRSEGQDTQVRYSLHEEECWDSNGEPDSALLQVGRLKLRLALEYEVKQGYNHLGIARVIERRSDNSIVLDGNYCPPCLDYRIAHKIALFVVELNGLLSQRSTALSSRLTQTANSGAAQISDFLMLQLINRAIPLFRHFSTMKGLHPEALYRVAVQLAGELATFSKIDKRPIQFPEYQHDHLQETFLPVIHDLRQSLSLVLDVQAIPLPLEKRKFGIQVALLPDPNLVKSSFFVLAVSAQLPPETLRIEFPQKVKIGSVEKISDLVNLQLPGVGLRPLAVAPRELPFHSGHLYFELDRRSEPWKDVLTATAIAIHVAGDFLALNLQLWAIRKD